jgi:hypothetical protein
MIIYSGPFSETGAFQCATVSSHGLQMILEMPEANRTEAHQLRQY